MDRHAFLIIAHKNYSQLNKLIALIDHENADIFIHIDKKSPEYVLPKTKHSIVMQISRIRTNWGGYSLVECELNLLEAALLNDEYSFFHLLSGQDLLIKPIGEVLSFFDNNKKFNFVHFDKCEISEEMTRRAKYYYLFQEYKVRGKRNFWSILQKIIIIIQKTIRIDRTKEYNGKFKSGSQWWSIRRDLAKYILSQKETIKRLFKYTMCDEMFMQTLIFNSEFYDTVYIKEDDMRSNQRLIDFERGHPYVWTVKDIEILKSSELLIARKFDETIDKKIVDYVSCEFPEALA